MPEVFFLILTSDAICPPPKHMSELLSTGEIVPVTASLPERLLLLLYPNLI